MLRTSPAETGGRRTHEVLNQPPPLVDYNVFSSDAVLAEGARRYGVGSAWETLCSVGAAAGSEEAIRWGVEANSYPPVLRTHDRFGHRVDEVEFHPSWHRLMESAVGRGLHASPWSDPGEGAHVARAAAFYVWGQVEAGHGCPISMTYACIPALRRRPEIAAAYEPLLTSRVYEFGLRSPLEKRGILCGMAMTEKQGGSDVRANTTRAEPTYESGSTTGGAYLLTGHKWFCSAPMCDVFLMLAQAQGGLSCFLVPRILPDGSRNAIRIQRLKDKLGNRSNASSEIELDGAWGEMIGEEGRGVPTIIEMVNLTRLDCVIGSASIMRQAVTQAVHHAAHRQAFGRTLIDQPLMRNVLADLAIESEAATLTFLRLARACDEGDAGDEAANHFRRLATAVSKYWICKRCPGHAVEALECLGGAGYVEESVMPRLYREAPLNGIWEGSGNVNALDVLRAMTKQPESVQAFFDEVEKAKGGDSRLDAAVADVKRELSDLDSVEARARRLVERLALVLQGSLMVRHGLPAAADAFCSARLGGDSGLVYGTLPSGTDFRSIVDRCFPTA